MSQDNGLATCNLQYRDASKQVATPVLHSQHRYLKQLSSEKLGS